MRDHPIILTKQAKQKGVISQMYNLGTMILRLVSEAKGIDKMMLLPKRWAFPIINCLVEPDRRRA